MPPSRQHRGILEFGVFQLDLTAGQLRKCGRVVNLAPQPFRVLALLTGRPGELVTREEIRHEIWGDETIVDFEAGLNFAVNKIRVALGDGAQAPRFIETVPRRGYRFVATVTKSQPTQALSSGNTLPEGTPEPGDAAQTEPRTARRRRAWLGAVVSCAVILLILPGRSLLREKKAAVAGGVRSIAVLPFKNLSRESRDDSVGDGTAEELITELGKVNGLRVISRTSSFRYRDNVKSLPEIGRTLGADTIVEGAVTVWEGRVRVNARLIEAATDRQLWSGTLERETKDVLTLQVELARQITAAASVHVSPKEHREPGVRAVNPEAYECYLRGRLLWSRQTDIRKSIREFEQAVLKDPGFALALAALADAHLEFTLTDGTVTKEMYQKISVTARKALDLEPNLAEAVNVLAKVAAYCGRWPEATRLFQRALELNPSYAQAYHDYGFYLMAMGRLEEATVWAKNARLLDPLSVTFAADLAWMPHFLRQDDTAIRALREVEAMEPNSPVAPVYLALALQQKGDFERAITAAKRAVELDSANYAAISTLGFVYGRAGKKDEAIHILNKLHRAAGQRPALAFHLSMIYLGLGDADGAMEWLDRAYQERFYMVNIVNVMPEFDPLRGDRRFQRIVRQMGRSD